jgi:iron complex transport system ATP-binding protein
MIKTESIHHEYGDEKVLNDVNIHVKKKQFVGIVGPNGSGKSTLLKCIYRVLKPTGGIVKLENQNIENMKVHETAKKMAVVAQHNQHSFDFIVEDMVLMGRSPFKKALERNSQKDHEIVSESLKIVDMIDYRKREFSSLSGGEQQRIILARALAQKPECLILDEPTNHLDIKHQLQLINIIKDLNISVVAAMHDLNIAMKYCDYVYVLKNGNLVSCGKTENVLTEEMIKDVFEVSASVHKFNGESHIVFKGPLVKNI